MPRVMNIGEAAEAAGISAKMIRHYEQIGLVPAAVRTESGYRQYTERDVSILHFIRRSRRLGFSMQQISDLLGLWSNRRRASRQVKVLAQGHLEALEAKMREMVEMQRALKQLLSSCHGDDNPHCAILEELAVSSPEAPEPGAVGAKPIRKSNTKPLATRLKSRSEPTANVELMAWTPAVLARHHRR